MNTPLQISQLDKLFPFCFTTDENGVLVHCGRSLPRLVPQAAAGRRVSDLFHVLRPTFVGNVLSPASFMGELLMLQVRPDPDATADAPRIVLRGQVLPLGEASDRFLFAVGPAITDMDRLSAWNLTFSDFAVGDPLFDFLILHNSERATLRKAESALERLEFERRMAQLLHRVTSASADLTDAGPAFELTLAEVCRELQWQFGHAFLVDPDAPDTLVSSQVWYPRDAPRYAPLLERTRDVRIPHGVGMPGRAFANARIEWFDDVTASPDYQRRDAFAGWPPVCGVAVPVLAHGHVVAVLEFYAETPQRQTPDLMRFFETAAAQVSAVIERQQAIVREKEHLAAMTMSARLQALGQMAAGIGHEINNPLAALLLTSQQLLDMVREADLEPAHLVRSLERIEKSGQRIATIVNGLRAFSRESSTDPLETTTLQRIVDDTLALCHARFKGGEVRLDVSLPPSNLELECRPVQVSQVLLNLLNNAFDAVQGTPAPWVRLTAQRVEDRLAIEVVDSGLGIPAAIADRIMSPFVTTKPVGQGTGLGLSISARILESYRGRLWLDSEAPNTTFRLEMPRRQSAAD